ncbi:MAG: hypothetical protein V2I67_18070 [Thermoanaerobaculales bacterium]|nr:hypothetical protein [Thermoanaerobaculales bacterium]
MTTTLILAALASFVLMGCSSLEPTDDPGVERAGRYVLINKGPEAEVAVGYRHAQNNLGSEWLLLEAAVTSPPGQTARILREKVSVRTPAGAVVSLATQKDFNESYSSLQAFLRSADVVRDPMDYWPPRKQDCAFRFFVAPGQGVSFDEFSVNDFRACQGRLLFDVPGGVQPGRYVLSIDLEESEVEIPFTLED